MVKSLLLLLAFACCVSGMACLALAMDVHWRQLRSEAVEPQTVRILRIIGSAGIFGALLPCLYADHASMAALVWIMMTAAAALSVAFILSWRPRLLNVLLFWLPRRPA